MQRAGVVVRMVTGDNIHTARHIAKECGLFDEAQGHVALEVGGGWGDEACLGNIYRVDRLCRVCVHVRLLLCMVRHVLAWWATWTGQALDATHVETCHMRHGTATKQLKVNVMVFAWRAPPPPAQGPVFRTLPAAELMPLLPNLRVLARSSPEDKLTLVRLLKSQVRYRAVRMCAVPGSTYAAWGSTCAFHWPVAGM